MTDATETPTIETDVPCPHEGDDRVGVRVAVPFKQSFVDDLKNALEHGERRWNPNRETWWVAPGHLSEVEDLVAEAFGGYQLLRPDGSDVYRDGSGEYAQDDLFGRGG